MPLTIFEKYGKISMNRENFLGYLFFGGFGKDTPGYEKLGILRFSIVGFYQSLILLICIPFLSRGKAGDVCVCGREY